VARVRSSQFAVAYINYYANADDEFMDVGDREI
jgi:hypothetical protein